MLVTDVCACHLQMSPTSLRLYSGSGNPTHFKSESRHNHLQNSQNFIANQSKEDTMPTPRQSIPVKKRESTFEGVQRIVQRLVDDGFISEEFGERLIDEAAQNPDFATTIKLLGLLFPNIRAILFISYKIYDLFDVSLSGSFVKRLFYNANGK